MVATRASPSRSARSSATSTTPTATASPAPGWTTTGPRPPARRTARIGIARFDALIAAADDPAAAAALAPRRCALTPLDEPAHRRLIERLAAAGDRAGALLVGRDLAARLRAELGVDLAPATRALLASCAHPRPSGRLAARAAAAAVRAVPRAGRAHRRVDGGPRRPRRAGRARHRRGGHRQDPAGHRAGAAGHSDGGARVAVGAGVDVGGEAPLAVWQELARGTGRRSCPAPPAAGGWPAELGRLAPDLARALGAHTPRRRSWRRPSWSGCGSSTRCCGWSSGRRRRPVLLVAEDTHRADRASLALCAHIGRRLADLPVLFVLTRRDRPDAARRRRAAGRPRRPRTRRHRDRARPAAAGEVAEVARSVAALPDGLLDAGRRRCRRQPAARGREHPRAGRGPHGAATEPAGAGPRGAGRRSPTPARKLAEAVAASRSRALGVGARARWPPTAEAERRVLDTGPCAASPAASATGTRCSPRPPAPTCATRRAPISLWRSPSKRPPSRKAGERPPRSRGHLQPAGRDDLAAAALEAGRPARPLARRAARGRRVLGRGVPAPIPTTRGAARARRDLRLARPHRRVRPRLGDRAGTGSRPRRTARRLVPARAVVQDRRLQPARLARRLPAGPDLLPADAPAELRAQVLVGLAWNEASAGDPARAEPPWPRRRPWTPRPTRKPRPSSRSRG